MFGVFGNLGYGEASAMVRGPDPSRQPQGMRPAGWGGHRARPIASSIFGGAVYEYDAAKPVSLQPRLMAPTGGSLAGFGMIWPQPLPQPVDERMGRTIPITRDMRRTLPITHLAPMQLPIAQRWPGELYARPVPAPLPIGGGVSYQGFGGLTGFGS